MNPEHLTNRLAEPSTLLRDGIKEHVGRWEYMREDREAWTREAWRDKRVMAGDVFNDSEKEFYREMERDVPNYNLALPMRNIIAGTEAQTRADVKYQAVGPDDVKGAEAATQVMRKVARANELGRVMSAAFEDSLDTGIGWIEVGHNRYLTGDPLVIDNVNPFDVWVDPAARKMNMSDATDLVRMKLLTRRQLARIVPREMWGDVLALRGSDNWGSSGNWDHSADFTNATGDYPSVNDEFHWNSEARDNRGRERLLETCERWYRTDRWLHVVRHPDGRWWETSPENAYRLAEMVIDGEAYEDDGFVQDYRYAMFCEDLMIGDWESPHKHRLFPFVPLWCYRDQHGRPMSIARLIRTAAKDFNARMANMLTRSLMKQVWMEENAVSDLDKMLEEIALPDGVVLLKPGALKGGKVQFRDELAASQAEAQLLQMDLRFITDLAGVTQEMAGQRSNADSGVAIQKKIQQSQTALFTLFDNRSWALARVGKLALSGIQQKYTREMRVRVTEKAGGQDWIVINKRDPATGLIVDNDITQADFDVEVSEVPLTASVRMAQFEAMAAFLQPMPTEVKLLFASKMAELADIPDNEDVSKQLEAFTQRVLGMSAGAPAVPTIDPELVGQLVQEGQLTREGAMVLLAQLARAVNGGGDPAAQPGAPLPQGPANQAGPSSSPPPAAPAA